MAERTQRAQDAYDAKYKEVMESGDDRLKFRDGATIHQDVLEARGEARRDAGERLEEIRKDVEAEKIEAPAYNRIRNE